uniref:LEM domain-containing protein n=1 Tax=Malurus cyaneus samueli TaxID=2593467 RepID=A0A8C5TAH0_9PASS
MPRRPPRLRVPRDAATSSGRCVTPQDGDVAGAEGQGTGSWGDTQILPGVPGVSPGVGSASSSGPTVLLGPGDKGHPQNSLSLIRGCPQHSPTVRTVLRSHEQPQESPSATRGPPSATSCPSPEGGSGWQHPSPLGISQSQWPHKSFRHPLDPRPPGSASGKLGTPSVPLSPTGSATPHSERHPEAEVQGQGPPECPSPVTEAISSREDATGRGGRMSPLSPRRLSDRSLRRWLRALGDNPGPVTELTRSLYRRRLGLSAVPTAGLAPTGHSPELLAALRTGHIPDCGQDELALTGQFERPECGRPWREGQLKSSFNYLLLDPRITQNLPQRSPRLSPAERFQSFVTAVFYVGKGTRARPFCHLGQALRQHRDHTRPHGHGVVVLQCFHHRANAEAHTRESCMLEALGLQPLTNERRGPCYGVAAAWAAERRQRLGVLLLHRAMSILLAEGECQLRPGDIPGGP